MLRTSVPMDVWMRQPEGCIETAIRMLNEQDRIDREDQNGPDGDRFSGPGPQMSG